MHKDHFDLEELVILLVLVGVQFGSRGLEFKPIEELKFKEDELLFHPTTSGGRHNNLFDLICPSMNG